GPNTRPQTRGSQDDAGYSSLRRSRRIASKKGKDQTPGTEQTTTPYRLQSQNSQTRLFDTPSGSSGQSSVDQTPINERNNQLENFMLTPTPRGSRRNRSYTPGTPTTSQDLSTIDEDSASESELEPTTPKIKKTVTFNVPESTIDFNKPNLHSNPRRGIRNLPERKCTTSKAFKPLEKYIKDYTWFRPNQDPDPDNY
ncbi:MAG: hypothetical protein GY823_00670, partial [Flavobacteriaceae bacterium]|nr:hypothetical protein [Flavobacteriaceae bacterium]